ncbi:unnamed protein product [Rangifer tarandus platyrhynchus]|uniref:Uncharacterized protein n=1 Tax=Rangifer tarandus platyrhynchus TaxID=3082113 RepID=A0AC59YHU0_RANTA
MEMELVESCCIIRALWQLKDRSVHREHFVLYKRRAEDKISSHLEVPHPPISSLRWCLNMSSVLVVQGETGSLRPQGTSGLFLQVAALSCFLQSNVDATGDSP